MRALRYIVSAVCISLSACSTTPVGGTASPSSTAEPPSSRSTARPLPSAAKSSYPSIAATEKVEFLGKEFTRKWQSTGGPVKRYEYYLAKQAPHDWLEMFEFQVYSFGAHGESPTPTTFAKIVAHGFRAKYPQLPLGIYVNKKLGNAMLFLLYPTSTRHVPGQKFLEFDAFRFLSDPVSKHLLCIHYAKNIEAPSSSHSASAVESEVRKTRKEVFTALALFKTYRE